MGTASFMISEGWKVKKPRSSQRCAPLPMWPITSTTTSSTMPTAYTHGAEARSDCGRTCASATIATEPMPSRAIARNTMPQFCPEALYSTMKP